MSHQETAFPVTSEQSVWGTSEQSVWETPEPGMTLLDYFAGCALTGWLASYGVEAEHPCATGLGANIARLSYEMAEEMLKHRAIAHKPLKEAAE